MTETPFVFQASAGTKSAGLSALDAALMFGQRPDGELDEHGAYRQVAWVRRCVELRANALSSIPARVTRGTTEIEWEFADQLASMLWLAEASLQLYGATYWERQRNRYRVEKGYRWLSPRTIRPRIDTRKGLIGWTRTLPGGAPMDVALDDIVYVWQPSLQAEVGPGVGWVTTALTAAGLAQHADTFAADFFRRGAIPALVLSVEGNPPREELERLQSWWKRLLAGVRGAWETVAVKASVKPQVVGYPTNQLAMPELMGLVRQQIATAAGVPQTMLEDAANYACLPGDQLVWTPTGPRPIATLKQGDVIWQMVDDGMATNTVEAIIPQGLAPVYEIRTPHRTLRASDNHLLLAVAVVPGRWPRVPWRALLVWRRADQLRRGDLLVGVEEHPNRYSKRPARGRKGSRSGRYVPGVTAAVRNLTLPSGLGIERVASVEFVGEQEVYDLCTTGSHTFVAEGLVVHNTAREHHQAFYQETVIPEAIMIRDALNAQVFAPQGLELALDWQELDIFQEDESQRSDALLRLTQAQLPLPLAMEILGFDLPNGMTYDQLAEQLEAGRTRRAEEQRAIAVARASAMQPVAQAQAAPQQGSTEAQQALATRDVRDELDRWRRKSLSALRGGDSADVPFTTEVLDADEQAAIHEALAACTSAEEVKAAFERPFRYDYDDEGTPYP